MKSSLIALFFLAAGINASILARAACNADGCARAVTGTAAKPALSARVSDCSSFQRTTVTPDTSTITVQADSIATSVTSTTTTIYSGTSTNYQVYSAVAVAVAKRDAFIDAPEATKPAAILFRGATPPRSVPTYASSCSGSVRYASACSCFGITSTITTLPTPLSTTTTTSTTTSTSTVTELQPSVVVNTVVCKPATDYEYYYMGALFYSYNYYYYNSFNADLPTCCAACYNQPGSSCVAYVNGGNDQCTLILTSAGNIASTYNCPRGIASVVSVDYGANQVGIGPCGQI